MVILIPILICHSTTWWITLQQRRSLRGGKDPRDRSRQQLQTESASIALWRPKMHYHVHNSLLLVPVLSQINQSISFQSHPFKINFNITTQIHLVLQNGLLPSSLPHQNSAYISLLNGHILCPYHPWTDQPINIWWEVKTQLYNFI